MAYAYPVQRRIVVPAPAPPLRTLILHPPPPPVGHFAVPFVPAPPNPVLFPALPAIVTVPVRLNPAFLIQMDQQRTRALLQFMDREGLVPTQEEEMKRRDVIDQLKQVLEIR